MPVPRKSNDPSKSSYETKQLETQISHSILESILEDRELRESYPGLEMVAENHAYFKNRATWSSQTLSSLSKEFAETRLLRLARTKPSSLADLAQARKAWNDARKFRYFVRDSSEFVSEDLNGKKGWGMYCLKPIYVTTSSRIAKLDLLIEDLEERVNQLYVEERETIKALRCSEEAARKFAKAGRDEKLAGALLHAISILPATTGFVYFRRWSIADGTCWFKIGITNNPDRREAEQNVLPVGAETIVCVEVGSMDRARSIEAVFQTILKDQRIPDASNREIFHLTDEQISAVKAVLESLQ